MKENETGCSQMPEAAAATDPVLHASLAAVERSALCIRENGHLRDVAVPGDGVGTTTPAP